MLFAYREVAAAANEDGGAGRFVAVIGVVVVGKAAGVAVKQGVQLVVIVGADLGFSCLYQRGGLAGQSRQVSRLILYCALILS